MEKMIYGFFTKTNNNEDFGEGKHNYDLSYRNFIRMIQSNHHLLTRTVISGNIVPKQRVVLEAFIIIFSYDGTGSKKN